MGVEREVTQGLGFIFVFSKLVLHCLDFCLLPTVVYRDTVCIPKNVVKIIFFLFYFWM